MSKNLETMDKLQGEILVAEEDQPYEIPKNWTWAELGKLCSIKTGKLNANAANEDGIYPFFTCAREISRINNYAFDGRAILVTGNGDFNVKYYEGKFNAYQRTYVLENFICNEKYVYFYLLFTLDILTKNNRGSTIKYIRLSDLQEHLICLPPINEQNLIAEKVERLLGKIDEVKRLIDEAKETFEIRRAAILEQAFIGQLTKAWRESINSNNENYLNNILAEKKSLYEDLIERAKQEGTKRPMKPKFYDEPDNNNSLVNIPNTWNYTYLGNVIYDFKYGTSRKSSYENEGKPVIRIPNIGDEYVNLDDMKYLAADGNQVEEKVEVGDLLIIRSNGSRDLVGKCAIVDEKVHGYAYASYLIRMRTIGVYPKFIYWLMNSDIVKRQLFSNSKSSAGINNINTQELASIVIPIPPKEEQMELVRVIENLISKENEIYNDLLIASEITSLKQSVLSKAFRGELGTNSNNDESAIKLLKSVLQEK